MKNLAIDTETELTAPGYQVPDIVCLTYASDDGESGIFHNSDPKLIEFMRRALLDKQVRFVGQNVAYDFAVLYRHDASLGPLIWQAYDDDRVSDTMLREKLVCIRTGASLKREFNLAVLAKQYLNEDLEKGSVWRTAYTEYKNKPLSQWPHGATRYAIEDAIVTLGVWLEQEKQHGAIADEYAQARSAWWLHLTTAWGITTEQARVDQLESQMRHEHTELRLLLQEAGLLVNGKKKMDAIRDRVMRAYKGKPPKEALTPTGALSTSSDVCKQVAHLDPILADFARYLSLDSKLARDIKLMREGIIHARYGLAESGRTTCSPNIQNLPRDGGVRECFVPRPGYVFLNADYDGLELRTIAQMCLDLLGRSNLAKSLNAGRDPHCEVAATIARCSYEEARKLYKDGDHDMFQKRQAGKVANFGKPVGLGADTLVEYARATYGVVITKAQAIEIGESWLGTYPEFRDFFAYINTLLGPRGEASAVQLRSKRVRGRLRFTKACSTFSQGLGADAAKRAGYLLAKECYNDPSSPLCGCRIVLFCHDEFLLEAPELTAEAACARLAEVMCSGANEFLPDVPATTTPVIARRYSKHAKEIRDENGRVIPWDDAL